MHYSLRSLDCIGICYQYALKILGLLFLFKKVTHFQAIDFIAAPIYIAMYISRSVDQSLVTMLL